MNTGNGKKRSSRPVGFADAPMKHHRITIDDGSAHNGSGRGSATNSGSRRHASNHGGSGRGSGRAGSVSGHSQISSTRSTDSFDTRIRKSLGKYKILRAFNKISLMYRLLIILAIPVVFLAVQSGFEMSVVVSRIRAKSKADVIVQAAETVSTALKAFHDENLATAVWMRCNATDVACRADATESLSNTIADRSGPAEAALSEASSLDHGIGAILAADLDWRIALREIAGLSTHRRLVSTETETGRLAVKPYEDIARALISALRRFPRLVNTPAAAAEFAALSEALALTEQIAALRSLAALRPVPSLLRLAYQVDVIVEALRGFTRDVDMESLNELLASPAFVETVSNMEAISADPALVNDPLLFEEVKANATVAITMFESLGNDILGRVSEASHESYAGGLALVIVAVVVTALTCTVLTYALVRSVLMQETAMRREIELRRKTDTSVRKFFPSRFMSLLDVVDVNAVSPGMRSEMMLTSMFCDIRGFTELSEQMSPDEVFKFLLEFTRLVTPIIDAHRGYIDKFIGDAFLAVFVEPENAALAAVEVQAAMTTFNVQRRARLSGRGKDPSVAYRVSEIDEPPQQLRAELNEMRQALAAMAAQKTEAFGASSLPGMPRVMTQSLLPPHGQSISLPGQADTPNEGSNSSFSTTVPASHHKLNRAARVTSTIDNIRIGIGIHQGMCILGTLGDDKRIDGTIISDCVNVASRLEGLCGELGADIIISADTLLRCRSAGVSIEGLGASVGAGYLGSENLAGQSSEALGFMNVRKLGPFALKGRRCPVEIYEITQTNDPGLRHFKDSNRHSFDAAMDMVSQDDDAGALRLLETIRRSAPVLRDPIIEARISEIHERMYRVSRDSDSTDTAPHESQTVSGKAGHRSSTDE